MRLLFLGSPTPAVAPLEALAQAGYDLVGVVTQPDRPAGRKRTLTPPPVKRAAERLGLPVLQPATLRDPAALEALRALQPDMGVVAAYGEILRPKALAIPRMGYLNIHPSLLPLHRGATPVVGSILAGDSETGVTVMQLDRGMDSGPILAQVVVPLPPDARTGPLTDELFRLGADLLLTVLPAYAAGQLVPQPQDASQASTTRFLHKADGAIDWSLPALMIERQVRAYDPWPGTVAVWRGQPLKVLAAQVHTRWPAEPPPAGALPGTLHPHLGRPLVLTGGGGLELVQVQPAGKRPMDGPAWLMGQRAVPGERFAPPADALDP